MFPINVIYSSTVYKITVNKVIKIIYLISDFYISTIKS